MKLHRPISALHERRNAVTPLTAWKPRRGSRMETATPAAAHLERKTDDRTTCEAPDLSAGITRFEEALLAALLRIPTPIQDLHHDAPACEVAA